MDDLYIIMNSCRKTNPRDHEWVSMTRFLSSKNSSVLKQGQPSSCMCILQNAKYLSIYLSFKKKHDTQDMCKTISHAFNACSLKYDLF